MTTPAPPTPQVRDSGPLQSKKFLAYLIAELTSKILIGCGLFIMKDQFVEGTVWHWWWMITITICVTFLEVGAVLGIAYVDKFVRTAQIMSSGPNGGDKKPSSPSSPSSPSGF